MNFPDRVSIDLRKLARQEREAELEYQTELPNRKFEAFNQIQDPNELRKILNDEVLSTPLARAMYNLKDAQKELAELQFRQRDRVQEKEIISLRACMQSLSHIEMMLFNMAMGDE